MFLLFTMINKRSIVAHQKSKADVSLFFNSGTFEAGIIQSCGHTVNLTVTTGKIIAVDGTAVHTQIHQVVRGTLKGKSFFRKRHNEL